MKPSAWLVGAAFVVGGIGLARAEHEDTIPRAVVERRLGPLVYADALPDAFRACRPYGGGLPSEETRVFFSSAEMRPTDTTLIVDVDCLDGARDVVTCTPATPRFIKGIHVDVGLHSRFHPEAVAPGCLLPVAPAALKTSRGIGLGASYEAVRAAYGPPSLKASARKGDEFYLIYTKGRDSAEADAVQFRFAHGAVYAIDLSYGEGEKQWK
ncbi:MAG TPA: hypothetical protein VHJ20_06285 [Polyangia bacterium]|nr:hypothetical protein [Polyangia bacterium]